MGERSEGDSLIWDKYVNPILSKFEPSETMVLPRLITVTKSDFKKAYGDEIAGRAIEFRYELPNGKEKLAAIGVVPEGATSNVKLHEIAHTREYRPIDKSEISDWKSYLESELGAEYYTSSLKGRGLSYLTILNYALRTKTNYGIPSSSIVKYIEILFRENGIDLLPKTKFKLLSDLKTIKTFENFERKYSRRIT